jgi:hypothetical protein
VEDLAILIHYWSAQRDATVVFRLAYCRRNWRVQTKRLTNDGIQVRERIQLIHSRILAVDIHAFMREEFLAELAL